MKNLFTILAIILLNTTVVAQPSNPDKGIEPAAGTWKPWVIPSGNAFRILPPPKGKIAQAEIKEMISLQSKIDTTALRQINYWNAGPPSYRWQSNYDHLFDSSQYALRVYSLVNVAIYDATLAAWDSKYAYKRQRPATSDGVKHYVSKPESPSYPCEHSVTAGAAATMLAYLFPAKADSIMKVAKQVGQLRVLAGVQYPSDVKAGFELGVKVAEYIIEHRAKVDGGKNKWKGKIPTEPGYWKGKPLRKDVPNMKPWVLTATKQFRSTPPTDPAKDMAELKAFKRTDESNYRAFKWEGGWPWGDLLDQKIMEYGLMNNPPRAARAYTLLSVADYENQIANIESKYVYFRIRPDQYDTTFVPVFETPPSPGYPAGHATVAGCYATVLAYLFPYNAKEFFKLADEEALSRFEAGVHFRSDNEAGMRLGKQVGNEIVKWAMKDGADFK